LAWTRRRGASDALDPEVVTGEEGRADVVVVVVAVVVVTGAGELVWASDIENAPSNAAVAKLNRFRGVAIVFMQGKNAAAVKAGSRPASRARKGAPVKGAKTPASANGAAFMPRARRR
jgi:hypothetical protein